MEHVSTLAGKLVYFDANIFIYLVEGYAKHRLVLQSLAEMLDDLRVSVVTSELTRAEVLVGPLAASNHPVADQYRLFLDNHPAISVQPISRDVLESAAVIRAAGRVRLPDAIHVATATLSGCQLLLTNDLALAGGPPIQRLVDLTV